MPGRPRTASVVERSAPPPGHDHSRNGTVDVGGETVLASAMRIAALSIVVLLSSGCFVLDRGDSVIPGAVVGRCVDLDGRAVSAVVSIDGATRRVRSDDDGRFIVANLPAGTSDLRL